MVFAPEDKRAWQNSEVMAELEKLAKETDLLGGPPPEAFEPISEQTPEQETWEDEDAPLVVDSSAKEAELLAIRHQLMDEIERMAHQLAEAGRIKVAYRLERALATIKDIAKGG